SKGTTTEFKSSQQTQTSAYAKRARPCASGARSILMTTSVRETTLRKTCLRKTRLRKTTRLRRRTTPRQRQEQQQPGRRRSARQVSAAALAAKSHLGRGIRPHGRQQAGARASRLDRQARQLTGDAMWTWPVKWPGLVNPALGHGRPNLIFVVVTGDLFVTGRS